MSSQQFDLYANPEIHSSSSPVQIHRLEAAGCQQPHERNEDVHQHNKPDLEKVGGVSALRCRFYPFRNAKTLTLKRDTFWGEIKLKFWINFSLASVQLIHCCYLKILIFPYSITSKASWLHLRVFGGVAFFTGTDCL